MLIATSSPRLTGLNLAAGYSPCRLAFRYASINHVALPVPTLRIGGVSDHGQGMAPAPADLETPQPVVKGE